MFGIQKKHIGPLSRLGAYGFLHASQFLLIDQDNATSLPNIQSFTSLSNLYSVNTSDVTAIHGQDFVPLSQHQVSFVSGDVKKALNIEIIDDDAVEGEESFVVNLQLVNSSHPNATLGERTTTTIIIEDNDGVQPTEPPRPGM